MNKVISNFCIHCGKSIISGVNSIGQYIVYLGHSFLLRITGINATRLSHLPDESILIVGNGPSVNNIDIHWMSEKNLSILCVNWFASESKMFFEIRPKYYCMIDPFFYHADNVQSPRVRNLYSNLNKVDWNMTYICLAGQNTENINNTHIKIVYLTPIEYFGIIRKNALYNKNKANFGFQNVILASLFFCISSHAKCVYLCGVDSDWHRELFVDENNDVYRETVHFYGSEKYNITKNGQLNKGEFYKYIGYYYTTMKEFYNASKYAEVNNVPVYNLTLKSYIDVFEKKRVEEILP